MAFKLTSPSALLFVLALWYSASHGTLAHTSVYTEISTDLSKTTTIPSSPGCQSSSAEVCRSLDIDEQDHFVVQDSLSDTGSQEPVYNLTTINHQSYPHNSTTANTFSGGTMSEFSRLYNYMVKVNFYVIVVVYPSLGVIGLVSNILSGIILVRNGLGKPSNIFLLGMAVADSLSLLGAVNIPFIIKHFPKTFPFGTFFWEYSRSASFACYVFGVAFRCVSWYGLYVSAALCTVVTIERLIAVYLPLQFTNILTPTRAWLVCCGCFLIWLPYLVFTGITWYVFDYRFYPPWKIYGGEMFFRSSEIIVALDYYVAAIFGKFIPLAIVTAGSILISVKVSITLRKRRKMVSTSTKTSSSGSRTTTTLLVVCLTFAVTKIITLPTYLYSNTDIYSIFLWNYYGTAIVIAEYINAFCNFFIYVFLNKKYRIVFLGMFSRIKR